MIVFDCLICWLFQAYLFLLKKLWSFLNKYWKHLSAFSFIEVYATILEFFYVNKYRRRSIATLRPIKKNNLIIAVKMSKERKFHQTYGYTMNVSAYECFQNEWIKYWNLFNRSFPLRYYCFLWCYLLLYI